MLGQKPAKRLQTQFYAPKTKRFLGKIRRKAHQEPFFHQKISNNIKILRKKSKNHGYFYVKIAIFAKSRCFRTGSKTSKTVIENYFTTIERDCEPARIMNLPRNGSSKFTELPLATVLKIFLPNMLNTITFEPLSTFETETF